MQINIPKTVYNKEKFVKSLPAEYDGIFDWNWMEGLFPRDIMPTDIDGAIEYNGHFLTFETKGSELTMVPRGQLRMIEALIRTNYFAVMIIWGDNVEKWTLYYINNYVVSGVGVESAKLEIIKWKNYIETYYDEKGKLKYIKP